VPGALIGRTRELDDLESRIRESRLVTVVGPGGVGKTALAAAVTVRVADRFPSGVRHVDLTRVDDAAVVPGTIATQLGFDSFDALLASPVDQPALLVVDNCEHLLDATAEAVLRLLGACLQPSVVATSRSPLDLPGESVISLAPLALPRDGDEPLASPSVALFLQRCRDNGAEVSAGETDAVVELCRRLDGLPLALEIAAARTRTMTITEISARLDERIDVLDRPRFRGDPRHRSVATTVRWSYDLLDAGPARLLEQLAVFVGPFTASTARAVADDGATFDADLDELVHTSLVVVDTSGSDTEYRLLDTVRRFALDRLVARDGVTDAYGRFVDHVVAGSRAPRWPIIPDPT
jgi:predicted ATPase